MLLRGDCLETLKNLPDNSVDSVVTDPPYELGFMGKSWDNSGIAYNVDVWQECLRVLKPGGHLLAFGGSRTYHRLASAVEDAGFEIRDQIMWVYGCLDDRTEILIDGRWEPYHNINKGGLALCYDVENDEYLWRPIQRVVKFHYRDTAYRLSGSNTDQLVTREHRCLVERDGRFVFQEAQEIARQRQARVPILENVSELLDAIPCPDQGTGNKEQDLLESVFVTNDKHDKKGATKSQGVRSTDVSDMSEEVPQVTYETPGRASTSLLSPMSRSAGRRSDDSNRSNGSFGVDGGVSSFVLDQNERPLESSMEGRRDIFSQAWKLRDGEVRPLPGQVGDDGSKRRLCHGASSDSCDGDESTSIAERGCTSCGPQPYEQRARQLDAIRYESGPQTVRASRFTTTDLVTVTPEAYDGVMWCVTVPTGAFVARRNGKVFVTGNSGFPKSLDVSKAIDKAAGNDRKSDYMPNDKNKVYGSAMGRGVTTQSDPQVSDEAKTWQGWGTALKPAHEPIVVARKPLIGTVASNVLQYGTGALNINGCRVDVSENDPLTKATFVGSNPGDSRTMGAGWENKGENVPMWSGQGRWPANFIHDGSDDVVESFPMSSSPWIGNKKGNAKGQKGGKMFGGSPQTVEDKPEYSDAGSAARYFKSVAFDDDDSLSFFYCAKTSKSERNAGLDSKNLHPTVKPLALMRYLVRLVTPPGGVVLDPFLGSGTTAVAAILDGFDWIGCEKTEDYLPIIDGRIKWANEQVQSSQEAF